MKSKCLIIDNNYNHNKLLMTGGARFNIKVLFNHWLMPDRICFYFNKLDWSKFMN